MVADDLALAASTTHDMQVAFSMAEMDASREQYQYNAEKIKTVSINVSNHFGSC